MGQGRTGIDKVGMTERKRDWLRKLQDDLLEEAGRCGYSDETMITVDRNISLGDLRHAIWPEIELTMVETLDALRARERVRHGAESNV